MGLFDGNKPNVPMGDFRSLLIYAYPKVGKTTLFSSLPNHWLGDFDPEAGAAHTTANADKINTLAELTAIKKFFADPKNKDLKYKFIVLDPIDEMLLLCKSIALLKFNKFHTLRSRNKTKEELREKGEYCKDVVELEALPFGAGQRWIRDAFKDVLRIFRPHCEHLILVCHSLDKTLDFKKELTTADIALPGKLKNIVCGMVDGIALLRKTDTNVRVLDFGSSNAFIAGSRVPHISGQIKISEKDPESGVIKTFWPDIFSSLKS